MKLGTIDITKAYYGTLELTTSNAFLGEVRVIDGYAGLTFTSSGSSTIGLDSIADYQTIEYSTDGETWTNFAYGDTISMSDGDKVYMRGMLVSANTAEDYTVFEITGDIKASGNLNYIWNYNNPDAELKPYCGYELFLNCDITDVSKLKLPATTLAEGCYYEMFSGTKISTAPKLPATTMVKDCYYSMFQSCDNLTTAPELPATTLAEGCYAIMFRNCTGLTTAPELPATILAKDCYDSMFENCFSLTTAPVLPATALTEGCYREMFASCTGLTEITCLATDISASACTYLWTNNVASAGTFYKDENMTGWTLDSVNGIPSGWTVKDDTPNFLKFTAVGTGSTIGLNRIRTFHTLQYSYDNETWSGFTTGNTITLSSGDSVYFRGVCSQAGSTGTRTKFTMSGDIKISGNINLLLNYTDEDLGAGFTMLPYMGFSLFEGCRVVDASELLFPADTLAEGCYWGMFHSCQYLTAPPTELPANNLATSCYEFMFERNPFTTAPMLPAAVPDSAGYHGIFNFCSRLVSIVCLAESGTIDAGWANGCAVNGTVYKSPNADASLFSGKLPAGWTVVDYAG